jgi:hypothetical protein
MADNGGETDPSLNESLESIEKPEKKESMFKNFLGTLTEGMKEPTCRYNNIASIFKYLGEYAFLFFMPAYFQ